MKIFLNASSKIFVANDFLLQTNYFRKLQDKLRNFCCGELVFIYS